MMRGKVDLMTDSLDPVFPSSHQPESNEKGWQDLLDEESYRNDGAWTYFNDYEGYTPHQRWKIHISSKPEKGREVAEAVLPYLQENSLSHKITELLRGSAPTPEETSIDYSRSILHMTRERSRKLQ